MVLLTHQEALRSMRASQRAKHYSATVSHGPPTSARLGVRCAWWSRGGAHWVSWLASPSLSPVPSPDRVGFRQGLSTEIASPVRHPARATELVPLVGTTRPTFQRDRGMTGRCGLPPFPLSYLGEGPPRPCVWWRIGSLYHRHFETPPP